MAKRRRFMDELMAEHIYLQGCPQIIVTRGFAYQYFVEAGCPVNNGSYNSADFMAFHQKPMDEPLTDLSEPWVVKVLADMKAYLA